MKLPWTIIIFLYIGPSPAPAEINIIPFATNNVDISSAYHGKISSHIKNILTSAKGNGCPDSASVTYYIPSRIPSDYSRVGIVTNNSQRTKINSFVEQSNGNIVFVRQLSACGRYENDNRVAGCAAPNSVPVVEITGDNPRDDAISILHEIGHSFNVAWGNPINDQRGTYKDDKGNILEDPSHVSDKNRLMYYSITGKHKISNSECNRYKSGNSLFKRTPQSAVLASEEISADTEQASAEVKDWTANLREVLGLKWLHGPLRLELEEAFEAAGGADKALDEVRRIIVSNEFPNLWSNSLTTLGIYGTNSDLKIIEYFLQREVPIPDGKEQIVSDAKISAARASGRLLERYQSEPAAILSSDIVRESQEIWAGRLPPEDSSNVNLSGLSQSETEFTRTAIVQEVISSQTETAAALMVGEGSSSSVAVLDILSETAPYLGAILQGDVAEYSTDTGAEASGISLLLEKLEPGFIEGLSEVSTPLISP